VARTRQKSGQMAAGTAAAAPPPSPFKLLWPAYFCVVIDFMGLGIAFPITPTVVAELGGTAADASMTLGIFNAAQFVGNVIMGRVSDRVGRRPVVLMSIAATTGSFVLAGFSDSLVVLYLARGICGICGGTLPVAQAMVLDVVADPAERPKYIALCGAALGIGFMVGPAIGAAAAALFSASGAWFAGAGAAGIGGIIAMTAMQESHPKHSKLAKAAAADLKAAGSPPAANIEAPAGGLGKIVYAAAMNMFLTQCESERPCPCPSVYACARARVCAVGASPSHARAPLSQRQSQCVVGISVPLADAFGTMIGLSGSEMNIQFGFGPTELGMVMTCVGLFQVRDEFRFQLALQNTNICQYGLETDTRKIAERRGSIRTDRGQRCAQPENHQMPRPQEHADARHYMHWGRDSLPACRFVFRSTTAAVAASCRCERIQTRSPVLLLVECESHMRHVLIVCRSVCARLQSFPLQQPSTGGIVGAATHPLRRGAAMVTQQP